MKKIWSLLISETLTLWRLHTTSVLMFPFQSRVTLSCNKLCVYISKLSFTPQTVSPVQNSAQNSNMNSPPCNHQTESALLSVAFCHSCSLLHSSYYPSKINNVSILNFTQVEQLFQFLRSHLYENLG